VFAGTGLSLATVADDVAKRPYITVGFATLLLLVPLAVTSTKGWVKRLGGKRWQRLHRLVYVAAAGGVLHFLWLVKADTRLPVIYGLVLIALLSFRVVAGRRRRQARVAAAPPTLEPKDSVARG
jgi:sulfoxide reductase heme-binding subunit YedZ